MLVLALTSLLSLSTPDLASAEIQRAVSSRMEVNLKLEQDDMEGVDEREWWSEFLRLKIQRSLRAQSLVCPICEVVGLNRVTLMPVRTNEELLE
uniref:Uncharacterized protein n=2 Tax=Timema TaxID=61471 RepID=A0A7R9DCD2_TIMPO|nr:unnamed protein product [Timema poppensis]